jgi:DNA-binding transcriptional MerR regulator
MGNSLPPIPSKRYFTIGEVAELCGVKPHVLRYWEQEFTQLRPMKRRGNRRYYQRHEVVMIRRIRALLYDQGFTISGARNKLQEHTPADLMGLDDSLLVFDGGSEEMLPTDQPESMNTLAQHGEVFDGGRCSAAAAMAGVLTLAQVRQELFEIRALLSESA